MNNRKRKIAVYYCYHKEFLMTLMFGPMLERSKINYKGVGRTLEAKDKQVTRLVAEKVSLLEKKKHLLTINHQ